MSLRAALYARVSTHEQTEKFSIPVQVQDMRDYCVKHGYQIVAEHAEDGSGAEISRERLQELLSAARAGAFEVLVVWRYDRFIRDHIDQLVLARELFRLGVKLRSVTQDYAYDTSDMGPLMMGITGWQSENERKTILMRSKAGMRQRVKEGKFSGGQVPYGYAYDSASGRLQILEAEAKWVKKMFNWSVKENLSAWKIAERLTAMDVPLKRGSPTGRWQDGTVHRILKNPLYMGQWAYGKSKENKRKVKTWLPRDQWLTAEAPAIVSAETFRAAQEATEHRRVYSPRNTKYDYLLQGLIVCGECGRTYLGVTTFPSRYLDKRTGKKRTIDKMVYYKCAGRSGVRTHGKTCQGPHIMANHLEPVIWAHVMSVLENPEEVLEAAVKQDQEMQAVREQAATSLAGLNEGLQRVKAEEERLLRLHLKARLSEEEFDRERTRLAQERSALQIEKARLSGEIQVQDQEKDRIQAIRERLADLRGRLATMTFAERKALVQDLVMKVEVSPDRHVKIFSILKAMPRTNRPALGHPKPVQFMRRLALARR